LLFPIQAARSLRHHVIESLGNLFIQLERRKRLGKLGILFQRHAMLPRHIDDAAHLGIRLRDVRLTLFLNSWFMKEVYLPI